jgi:hypothetical protein
MIFSLSFEQAFMKLTYLYYHYLESMQQPLLNLNHAIWITINDLI